jgi:hypothetical protein
MVDLTINFNYTYKSYVAKITGLDEQYGFQRIFINPSDKTRSSTGKTGTNTYDLDDFADGIYEIQEVGEKKYYNVVAGKLTKIDKKDVKKSLKVNK